MPAHRLAGAKQHLAIVAAVLLGRGDVDGVEPLLDGAGGFVGGEHALAWRYHGESDFVEISEVHRTLLPEHERFASQNRRFSDLIQETRQQNLPTNLARIKRRWRRMLAQPVMRALDQARP